MDFKEIQELMRYVNKSDLTEVEIEQEGFKLRIVRKNPENVYISGPQTPVQSYAPAPIPIAPTPAAIPASNDAPVAPAADANLHTFRSPMIGTFYSAATPNDPPFVKVGDTVSKGQKLCIIEAMKLFNDIECDVSGKIVKVLVDNSKPVDYDQPLFLIEKQ